jgi:membrane protease YdiL (CAAX protease family)
MSGRDRDPIESAVPALASALLAVIISMPIAAMIGNALGVSYESRSLIYVALIAWCCTGAIVLFLATLRAPRQPVSLQRVLIWTASIWIWPLLLWRRAR